MHFATKTVFAAALALLGSTTASANLVGPGNGYAGGYIGAVYSTINNLSGVNYSVHPTFLGCDQGMTAILGMVAANSGSVSLTIGCHYVPGRGTVGVMEPDPTSPERVIGILQQANDLRGRYNIDAYERELHQLWQAEDEGSDGSH
jgi:hypothetical protein